jgi:O-antigen ligase
MDARPKKLYAPKFVDIARRGLSWPPAIAWFLFLLPQFAIPAGFIYRPPAASLFLVVWVLYSLLAMKKFNIAIGKHLILIRYLIWFFFYCLFSVCYGYWVLSEIGGLTLYLTTGNIDYIPIALQRLLQILLMIVAFWAIQQSNASFNRLIRWWLNGTVFAAILHIFTYLISDDSLLQRAGTFNEGNLAGLYYLLSIFLALEYKKISNNRRGSYYLIFAIFGLLLSRSSAGILIFGLLFAVRYALAKKYLRFIIMLILTPLVGAMLINYGLDFGIGEKLFEEQVTPNSFSRIDRIESIRAAYQLFIKSPIFGNGLQTYGFLSNDIIGGPLKEIYDESYRRIPNNVYLEIAAELGLTGLIIFWFSIISLLKSSLSYRNNRDRNLLLGLVAALLYWNAFPTYSVIFIWVFFAITVKAGRNHG